MRWQFSKTADRRLSTALDHQSPSAVDDQRAELRCPLCGRTFHASEAKSCVSCSLANKCGLAMCPNCNYEFAI